MGVCRGCGAYTQPRNGKGDAYAYCKRCHPGAIKRRWTRELVISAMREWRERYGRLPSSYDWSRAHARARLAEALERLASGGWPAASVVTRLFGPGGTARAMAAKRVEEMSTIESAPVSSSVAAISPPKPPAIRRYIRPEDFAHDSRSVRSPVRAPVQNPCSQALAAPRAHERPPRSRSIDAEWPGWCGRASGVLQAAGKERVVVAAAPDGGQPR